MATSFSTLIAYFKYNSAHPEGPRYLYQEFPTHFVYQPKVKEWKVWEKGIAIGRMYTSSPYAGERYFLRLLLTIVPGARSFSHLRIVAETEHSTFWEAGKALGLLQDDQEWINYFTEAITFATGHSLRLLLSTALIHEEIFDRLTLWNQFKEHFCDDLQHCL